MRGVDAVGDTARVAAGCNRVTAFEAASAREPATSKLVMAVRRTVGTCDDIRSGEISGDPLVARIQQLLQGRCADFSRARRGGPLTLPHRPGATDSEWFAHDTRRVAGGSRLGAASRRGIAASATSLAFIAAVVTTKAGSIRTGVVDDVQNISSNPARVEFRNRSARCPPRAISSSTGPSSILPNRNTLVMRRNVIPRQAIANDAAFNDPATTTFTIRFHVRDLGQDVRDTYRLGADRTLFFKHENGVIIDVLAHPKVPW